MKNSNDNGERVPLWKVEGCAYPIYNHSDKFFTPADVANIISFVSDRVDDQINRLEVHQSGEVVAYVQDGKKVFPLSDIFPAR